MNNLFMGKIISVAWKNIDNDLLLTEVKVLLQDNRVATLKPSVKSGKLFIDDSHIDFTFFGKESNDEVKS